MNVRIIINTLNDPYHSFFIYIPKNIFLNIYIYIPMPISASKSASFSFMLEKFESESENIISSFE